MTKPKHLSDEALKETWKSLLAQVNVPNSTLDVAYLMKVVTEMLRRDFIDLEVIKGAVIAYYYADLRNLDTARLYVLTKQTLDKKCFGAPFMEAYSGNHEIMSIYNVHFANKDSIKQNP